MALRSPMLLLLPKTLKDAKVPALNLPPGDTPLLNGVLPFLFTTVS